MDYDLEYGDRVPSSYDIEALAALLSCDAEHRRRVGCSVLDGASLARIGRAVDLFCDQFRGVAPTGPSPSDDAPSAGEATR